MISHSAPHFLSCYEVLFWTGLDHTICCTLSSSIPQAPAELLGDTLTDVGRTVGRTVVSGGRTVLREAGGVLRVGGGALVAGAMLPAQGIKQVIKKIQDKVAEGRQQQP